MKAVSESAKKITSSMGSFSSNPYSPFHQMAKQPVKSTNDQQLEPLDLTLSTQQQQQQQLPSIEVTPTTDLDGQTQVQKSKEFSRIVMIATLKASQAAKSLVTASSASPLANLETVCDDNTTTQDFILCKRLCNLKIFRLFISLIGKKYSGREWCTKTT